MLTAVVLAKNEAKNIVECLKSLAFCDEIVIIDDYSNDETAELAKRNGAKVVKHAVGGDFSAARNFGLEQVKSGWVLFVDADETISKPLASEISNSINKIEYKGFLIPRHDIMWGKTLKYGDLWGVKILRLGRKGAGEWSGKVHESWNIEGRIGVLSNYIAHKPHPTVVDFLRHINHYSSLKANDFFEQKRPSNILQIIIGPIWRFLKLYIFKLGILDGTAGFVHAMIMGFYTFLVTGKLFLKYKGIPK